MAPLSNHEQRARNKHELRVCIVRCMEFDRELEAVPELHLAREANESLLTVFLKTLDKAHGVVDSTAEINTLLVEEQRVIQKALQACASTLFEATNRLSAFISVFNALKLDQDKRVLIMEHGMGIESLCADLGLLALCLSPLYGIETERKTPREKEIEVSLDDVLHHSNRVLGRLNILQEIAEILSPTSAFRQELHAHDGPQTQIPPHQEMEETHDAATRPSLAGALNQETNEYGPKPFESEVKKIFRETQQNTLLQVALRASASGRQALISLDKEADDALRQAAILKIESCSPSTSLCVCVESQQEGVTSRGESPISRHDSTKPIGSHDSNNLENNCGIRNNDTSHSFAPLDAPATNGVGETMTPPSPIGIQHLPLIQSYQTLRAVPSSEGLYDPIKYRDEISTILKVISVDGTWEVCKKIVGATVPYYRDQDTVTDMPVPWVMVKLVFEAACLDTARAASYARVCQYFGNAGIFMPNASATGGPRILVHCRRLINYIREFCLAAWNEKPHRASLDAQLGFPVFMGELYKQSNILIEETMHTCIREWLEAPGAPSVFNIGRLYHLLKTAGRALDETKDGREKMNGHFIRISQILEHQAISRDVREAFFEFLIMEHDRRHGRGQMAQPSWFVNTPAIIRAHVEKEVTNGGR